MLLTTNILHRLWLVSSSSSATGAAYRFADLSSTDVSCWVQWVWNYHSGLQQCRTDQLPTATTGCAAECANTVSHSFIKVPVPLKRKKTRSAFICTVLSLPRSSTGTQHTQQWLPYQWVLHCNRSPIAAIDASAFLPWPNLRQK